MAARIAFTVAGNPHDVAVYSGAPAALVRELAGLDVEMGAFSTELPGGMQRLAVNLLALGYTGPADYARAWRHRTPIRLAVRAQKPKLLPSREMSALRSATLRHRMRQGPPWDRVIQFGTEYQLPRGTDYVTFDDATIVQLWRSYPYEWMQAVPERMLRRMIARQRDIFHAARACCVTNRWAAESAIDDYGVPSERVHIVGAGTNRAVTPSSRDWHRPVFLFVGKDFERKNGSSVLGAFQHVRVAHPDAELHVVGDHPTFDIEGAHGHGPLRLDRPDESEVLNGLFARATCFVMPSHLEPTGYVHAEALAAGIGSIGTRAGGVDTLIGDAGVTVGPDDLLGLIAQMGRFCDRSVMEEYGRRAVRRAHLFTWRAVAERVLRAVDAPGLDAGPLAEFL